MARDDPLLSPHGLYLQLGETTELRCCVYQGLFNTAVDTKVFDEMRGCLQSGTPFGNERFIAQIEQALKIKVGQIKRGRPRRYGL